MNFNVTFNQNFNPKIQNDLQFLVHIKQLRKQHHYWEKKITFNFEEFIFNFLQLDEINKFNLYNFVQKKGFTS